MARPLTALKAAGVRLARAAGRLRDRAVALRCRLTARAAPLRWTPEPLSPGDGEAAARLASGDLLLAGRRARLSRGSPFDMGPVDAAWAEALHGFDWLEHAAAAARPDRAVLRAWAFDALRRSPAEGWRADLAGRRLARLVCAAPILAPAPAERRLLERAAGRHIAFLAARSGAAPRGLPRLWAVTGLALGLLAREDGPRRARHAAALIGRAAPALAPGAGRSPQRLAEGFALLAWTAEALRERGVPLDPRHEAALGEIGPMLRALRLGDGGLARMHGGGAAADGLLDEALARAGPEGRGPRREQALGLERLAAGRAALLLDAAAPGASPTAGASPLALEASFGRTRLFGGVGAGAGLGADWALAARATAAHSAVEIAGVSAARLEPDGYIARTYGRRFAAGPRAVSCVREEADDALWLQGEHDGYRARFGLTVMRRLRLARDGRDLRGEDTLSAPDAAARARFDRIAKPHGGVPFCVRFHLGPGVVATVEPGGEGAALNLPDGARWRMRASGGALSLVESALLDDLAGVARQGLQLVIAGRAEAYWGRVTWAFYEDAPAPRRSG